MRRLDRHLIALLTVAMLGSLPASQALAQPEKILDTPTGWGYLHGATASQINTQINAGQRPITIQRTGSSIYDVVTVTNSGSYAVSGFGTGNMHYHVSLANLSSALSGRRLISIDCIKDIFNQTYVTAISVPNTGSGSVGWGWLVDTTRQNIINWVNNSSTPLRIVDLAIYERNGQKYYAAVVVYNTGSQHQNWWWYFDVTATQVTSLLQQHNARLLTMKVETPASTVNATRYAVVMVAQNPGAGWYYGSRTADLLASTVAQTGGRLTNMHRYTTTGGVTRYTVSLVDNAGPQTRRVRDFMAASATSGSYGFLLKQVGSSTIAALNQNFVFEPASTVKILHSSFAIRTCQLGQAALGDSIWARARCTDEDTAAACPSSSFACNPGNAPLQTAIRQVMQNSHNPYTRTLEDLYGRAVLNYYASVNGMPNTSLNHYIGCSGTPNTTSSQDLVNFYERIANGTLLNNTWRPELFTRMINLATYGFNTGLDQPFNILGPIIAEEAAGTSLSPAAVTAFREALQAVHKSGGYGGVSTFYRSRAGWYGIPFLIQSGGRWQPLVREYVYATFVHGGSDPGAKVAYSAAQEIVREQIRGALMTWNTACAGGSITSHPSSVTVQAGESVQFTVVGGVGVDVQYQWQRSHAGSWVNLGELPGSRTGTRTATLTLHAAAPSSEGNYRCRITGWCGVEDSNAAQLTVQSSPTSAPDNLPTHLVVHAPMPNPFNPQVTLRFELPRQTDLAVLEVFDVAGRRVRTLSAAGLAPGAHEFTWNGTDEGGRKVSSGMYLARLRAGGEQATHRLMMVE